MKTEVETIDRELAERYLNLDRGNNRPFSPSHLNDLIGRQKRGEWVTNGDTIRFDVTGQLRDGVHRLRMVKATGIPIEAIVVRDIDSAAFLTMDVGKKRNLSDVLYIEKESNYNELASTLNWTWRYLSRRMRGNLGSHEQMLKTLDQHPRLRDSVAFYINLNSPIGAPRWPAITSALHYLFSQVDGNAANDFIDRYVTGLRLEEPDDPIHILRGQIVSYATATRKPVGNQIFSLLTRAWNASREDRTVRKKFAVPNSVVVSPRINGFPKELFLESQLPLEETEEEE